MLGRFRIGKVGKNRFPSVIASFTPAILTACIHGRISVGVPIGMVGVATGSSGCAARYWRSTWHALSSVSGTVAITGQVVLVLDDDSLEDIMLPNIESVVEIVVSFVFSNRRGILELKLVDFVFPVEIWEV